MLGSPQGKGPQSGKRPNSTCLISELQKRKSKKRFLIDDYFPPGSYINQLK